MNKYTDSQLIELAAKAGGYNLAEYCSNKSNKYYIPELGCIKHWDPLDFDDDAFRLAAKLNISIEYSPDRMYVFATRYLGSRRRFLQSTSNDVFAATRRVIASAAADLAWIK